MKRENERGMRRWRIKYLGKLRALCVPAFQRSKMEYRFGRAGETATTLKEICIRRESYNVPQFRSMSYPAHTCIPLVYNDRNSDIDLTTTSIEKIIAPTLQEVRSRCRIRVQGLGQLNDSHASHLPAVGILKSRAPRHIAIFCVVREV